MAPSPDFLDELIAERTAGNPEFPLLVAAAERRRGLFRELAAKRAERDISQTRLAAGMGTSQSAVARLENSLADAKLSTVERYAAVLGMEVEYRLVPAARKKTAA
jgi:DNA-binding XRE family transcriptional regulator